jgi:hypothetical protein
MKPAPYFSMLFLQIIIITCPEIHRIIIFYFILLHGTASALGCRFSAAVSRSRRLHGSWRSFFFRGSAAPRSNDFHDYVNWLIIVTFVEVFLSIRRRRIIVTRVFECRDLT